MKALYKINHLLGIALVVLLTQGCKNILEEEPRSALFPSYLGTPGGVKAGLAGVYSSLRSFHSGEGHINYYVGTDEMRAGSSSSGAGITLNTYNGINSSTPNVGGWASCFADINTLNGVLKFVNESTDPILTEAAKKEYIAQAKFLRAYIHFYLVQTYGGTTATEKSGIPLHLEFITEAKTGDEPAPLSEIYSQIIQDLSEAAADLPAVVNSTNALSPVGKTATAATAKAYLAKVYLTKGYLSEISEPGDFQKAADLTQELITNRATYQLDLFANYNDVVKQENDYGKETLFAIDYGRNDPTYSAYAQNPSGGFGINFMAVLHRWNYISDAGIDNRPGVEAVPQVITTAKQPMVRDVYNGRPYIRVAPNPYVHQVAFQNQVNDTRWDATFQTFWINNVARPAGVKFDGSPKEALVPTTISSATSYQPPTNGDTAILMPGTEVTNARRDAFKGLIVTPAQYSNKVFPTLKKFDDNLRTGMNDFSSRPIILMRFSEVYLMNAEANYMLGNVAAAATQLNVIRRRAAFRTPADGDFIPKGQFRVTAATQAAANAANAAAMELTPAQLGQLAVPANTTPGSPLNGMDLILDEYTRELYGDLRRWYDLVRTRQLVRRVRMYNPEGAPNVQEYHMRRPIPQAQINNVRTGPAYPQNNGY